MPRPATQSIFTCLTQFSIDLPSLINLMDLCGDLHNDSRAIVEGDIFCAIIGHDQDGRQYIEQAINQGAKLVLAECESSTEHGDVIIASSEKNVAMVKFYQLNQHLFTLSKSYYQAPQDTMTIVGI
ncbi:MAG: Mur ligase domain-containing protein, partial [Colwellia sp.]